MSANGKMSLVVLRSWSDGPPKIRAIAPPDDDRAVYVPDHQGRFVTEEAKDDKKLAAGGGTDNPPPRCASSASQYKEIGQRDSNQGVALLPAASLKKTVDGVVYRKFPLQRCYAIANPGGGKSNRHSYTGAGANNAGLSGNIPSSRFSVLPANMHLSLQGVSSTGKESTSSLSRPESTSPDNPDASSLEYSPPASPVNGRYRNLGPELAATIPKRTVRNSWIAEVKQRWNNKSSGSNSNSNTHPSSRLSSRHSGGGVSKRTSGGGTLKSYSSSPSLICRNNKEKLKGVDSGKRASASGDSEEDGDEEEEEDGDYFDGDRYTIQGSGETPRHHRRNSLQGIHLDVDEDGVQQPFFNPLYKFAQNSSNDNSSGISANGGANDSCSTSSGSPSGNSFAFLRNQTKSPGQIEGSGTRSNSSTSSACGHLVNRRSASGIALSVDDDSQSDRSRSSLGYPPSNNSGNISYSPSPPLTSNTPNDHIYSSLTDIHELHIGKEGRLDPFKLGDTTGSSDVVLVEVIRKQGNGNSNIILSGENKTGSNNKKGGNALGEKYKLEKFGSVELIQKLGTSPTDVPQQTKLGKRHSVDTVDSAACNKISNANAKVEGNPGKVQRFKESLKRFGRFGRSNTDKITRAHSDSGFSTDEVHGGVDPKSSTEKIKRQSSEGEANSLYENPSEIIVTSLTETENDNGITVKPAPRKRSKQLESSASSPENLYTTLNYSSPVCSEQTSGSEPSSPQKFHKQIETDNETVDGLTDYELPKNEECEFKNGTKSPANSDTKTTILADITSSNDKSDRVSPTKETRKLQGQEVDDDDYLDDDGTRIPHLEFDKGGETENSTSHDESCSSRAESLTYSSTSHEQDRSMPQQIVQLNQQRCVIPKVDIVSSSNGEGDNYSPGSPTSIESGSSDTLNCEVTPVNRKRSSSTIEKKREQAQQQISASSGGGPGSSCQNEDDDQCSSLIKNNKQPVTKQISSSFVESSNNNNHSGGGNSLQKEDCYEKVAEELRDSSPSSLSSSNKESDCCEKEIETILVEKTSCEIPVTLNEPSDKASGEGDPDASASPSGTPNPNMHPFIRTRCKINSREMYNGGQQNTKNNLKPNLQSDEDNGHVNGTEGPEIMASKVENNSGSSGERNGMGKLAENGTASVQVPVQAVNRHVLGYGLSSTSSSISSNTLSEDQCNGSIASTISKNDSDWNRSSLRASLKGFCEDMLQQDKISVPIPDVVEAVINFDEDASSIEQDEERENSIEYISVANVKVNRQKTLEKINPRDDLPSCVIALDLGSRGSGYAYWIKEESEFVRIGNVDGGSSCPASHKAPSWVMFDDLYLDGEEDEETSQSIRPGFGFQALDKYLTDDAHGQISWKWRQHFHEGKSFPYTLDSKASDDDLIFMMKSAIRHYGRQAMEQISQRKKGLPRGPMVILIAIPSTFDLRARQLVREAALEAGILAESDSVALIEDSSATGLYSLHALKSKLNNESSSKVTEMSYLSVDCGAAYLHFSGYQVTEGKLRQLILPRSDPLIDSPESLFEAELSTIFTQNYIFNYQNKHKAGWLKLMTEFEHAKNRFDPLSKQNYYVFVPSSFVDHFRRSTNMEIEDALESSDMVWNKTGALGIPHWKMQRFLQPLLDYINDKIMTSMKKHKFEHLVVTGGRAGAKFYVDAIRTTAKGFGVTLHVPKEYNAAVLQGSTISVTNLAPRLVIRSRFSIGVGVMTPFSEESHPEEKRVMRDGKSWCADVWDSLIKADQELELNRVIIKRSYVGAQPGQSLLVLPLFKSPDEPKFVTESSVQKCCELKFTSGQRAWQEVELVIVCRPSEILIKAMDGGVMKSYVVVDFSD